MYKCNFSKYNLIVKSPIKSWGKVNVIKMKTTLRLIYILRYLNVNSYFKLIMRKKLWWPKPLKYPW